METKPGYKQTEVGVIPVEWECARMANIAKLESGHTPSKRMPSYWGGTIPWVSLFDTEGLQGKEISETSKMITDEGLNNSSARLLPKGTVVFSRTATVGKTTVMGREMATSQDFANYICGQKLHNHFLVYLFRSMGRTWKSLMAGSIHNTIYMPIFKALQIALPPVEEQRTIATALSDMDALLAALDRLIAKQRDLKQAAMQQLLTGQTRLPGFKGKWVVKRLGDVLKVRHGRSQHGIIASNGKYPILASGGEIGRTNAYIYDQPSVLIGRKGTIDSPQYVDSPFWTVDTLFFTEISIEADSKFIFYKFTMIRWRSYNEASGVPSLNAKTIENIEVSIPPLPEQTAIAEVLSDMDAELAGLEQRRDKTSALKQGMMQELLTGRTRLV